MRHKTLLAAALSLLTAAATARDYGQAATVRIWDNRTAPHSNGITTPETEPERDRIADTSQAELYIFPADPATATGQAVMICPGGGCRLLCMDYEGYDVAKWFAAHGITAAVLKYRMPNGHPEVPLEDAVQALRILSGEVPGAEGFTAEEGRCHRGSFDNLLGAARSRTDSEAYSLQRRVTPATPPTLLLLSDDDRTVPPVNATEYYRSLKEHGIDASMHIYPEGDHGWGIRSDFRYREAWQQAVLDWLGRLSRQNE